MKLYICDRCGAQFKKLLPQMLMHHSDKKSTVEPDEGVYVSVSTNPPQTYDLCSICLEKLLPWLNGA